MKDRRHARISSSSPKHRHEQNQKMCQVSAEEKFVSGQQNSKFAVAAEEEAEEEQRLAEQRRGSFYCKQTGLIRTLIMLSSVKLVAEPKEDSPQPAGSVNGPGLALCNVLRPVSVWPERLPATHCKPGASWTGRLVWPPKMGLLIVIYLHYAFVKLLSLSILSLKRHFILSHLKPSLQPQATQITNSCALSEDLYFNDQADWAEFEQLNDIEAWLKFLGISMVSSPEISVVSGFLLASLPLFYHHMSHLFLSLKRHRADTLYFMLDPLGERRRLDAELRNIVREIILSQSNHKHNLYYGFDNSEALHDSKLVVSADLRVSYQLLQADGGFRCSELAAGRWTLVLDDQARRLRYLQSLFEIEQLKQVDPYIVTSKWHKNLLRLIDILKLALFSLIAFASGVALIAILYDLCDATRLRLEMVECAKWRPQGGTRIVALDHLYLDELKSEEQLDAYKTHDGSTLSFLKLALLVESTSYFSFKRVVCWAEGLLADYILIIEWLVTVALHVVSTAEKIAWLNQLNKQVERAASQASEHEHRAQRFGPTQDDDERLLNTLTLVYLNYELFRRQQVEYLMLTDRITVCFILLPILSCLIIYSSGVSLGNSNPFVVFTLSSLLLISVNLILVASAYRLKKIEKIMIKATRILAHCSSGHIQLSYPLELWRRQLCAFEESSWCYASRLFGVNVTYETVISLNFYAIALVLILLKPQLGQQI